MDDQPIQGSIPVSFAALREAIDKLAIRELLERYWWGMARHDEDVIVNTFTPDAVCGHVRGHVAISHHMKNLEPFREPRLFAAGQLIEINGDTAHADSHALSCFGVTHDRKEMVHVAAIRYIDDLVRTPDGWRIAHRHGAANELDVHDAGWMFFAAAAVNRLIVDSILR